MNKSIYGDALAIIDNIYESDTVADFDYYDVRGLPLSWEVDRDELEKIKHALEQAQKQEKLLELYEKLATHRYIVIHNLLDDIINLKEGPNKSLAVDIDYILSDLDDYENGDIKITNEILKLKEL